MIRGVIFDMDGLLTDTEPVYYDIFTEILKEYGYAMIWQNILPISVAELTWKTLHI